MDLKELLGEELYNQVIVKAGDNKIAVVSDGSYIPKAKFDEKNNEAKEYKKQLAERDTQLEELSKQAGDNEAVKQQLELLKEANQKQTAEYETKLKQQTYDFALDRALLDAKAKNLKAVKALLNTESITLDGENLLGLTEQLTALQESDGYLFDAVDNSQSQAPKPSGYNPGSPQRGNTPKPQDPYQLGKEIALARHKKEE